MPAGQNVTRIGSFSAETFELRSTAWEIVDSHGDVVASSQQAEIETAFRFGGVYTATFTVIDADGYVGRDVATITVTEESAATGTVFFDRNGDGLAQGNEPGLADIVVYDDENANGQLDIRETAFVVPSAAVLPDAGFGYVVLLPIEVSGLLGSLRDLDVSLELTHENPGDRLVFLVSPAVESVLLFGPEEVRLRGWSERFSTIRPMSRWRMRISRTPTASRHAEP